jgi:hypothetical protein
LLSDEGKIDLGARCASFSPDGKKIAYLTTTNDSIHHSAQLLRLFEWDPETNKKLGKLLSPF